MALAIRFGPQASPAGFVRAPTHNASAWSPGQQVQSGYCVLSRRTFVSKSLEQKHRLLSPAFSDAASRVTMAGKDKMDDAKKALEQALGGKKDIFADIDERVGGKREAFGREPRREPRIKGWLGRVGKFGKGGWGGSGRGGDGGLPGGGGGGGGGGGDEGGAAAGFGQVGLALSFMIGFFLFTRFWKPALAFITNVIFIIFSFGRYRPGQKQRLARERARAALVATGPITLDLDDEAPPQKEEIIDIALPPEIELDLDAESTSGRTESSAVRAKAPRVNAATSVNAPEPSGEAAAPEGVKKAKGALARGADAARGGAEAVREAGEKVESAAKSAAGGVKRRVRRTAEGAAEGAKEAAGAVKRTAQAGREKVTGTRSG
ncbi:hypothetical protein KFL_000530040 [Klebsormidium nitens]|uniref:Uncharacterized protein n=1 Tax=Klebsormidium nitens TaxID=105231 RepID=A0A1Y1HV13_KLENI|nr:hypothetical protein KFL_000530040 [Klebsormidium nitens]|eukprot:GAQ80376.1 hypothetical protein KFL_000530040 [Klebsormidium nitens]